MKEIASLIGVPTVDTENQQWIGFHLPGAKRLLLSMTMEEQRKVEEDAKKMMTNGLPEHYQRK
jgi:hypothetical protein